ncbi:hypothetical protein MCAP1_001921 [Malassezia caprae]|uniref:Alpha,alpha-trehalose-phosphate synthase (UDP-forming) n=1 Tax=Malassezia caprae TaxID=1381934 RepID=A0AAF0E8D5_9BASI|nr:hypothetical protein MCAP1_001921 [Malassezia caprae]
MARRATGQQRPRRVLIAAFLLPHTVEFSDPDTREGERVPASPSVARAPNAQNLADALAAVAEKEEGGTRVFPGKTLPLGLTLGPAPGASRHPSHSAARDRVNMAELMAEAAGSGALAGGKASGLYSMPSSPRVATFDDARGASTQSHLVTPNKSSLSDHGRGAPLEPMRQSPPTVAPVPLQREMPPPPVSIISDMAAKSSAATPVPQDHSPFAMGPLTPVGLPGRPATSMARGTSVPNAPGAALTTSPSRGTAPRPGARLARVPCGDAAEAPSKTRKERPTGLDMRRLSRDDERRCGATQRFHITRRAGKAVRTNSYTEEDKVPFEFLPNPGANYGLINAVNSTSDVDRDEVVYVGTLGVEMNGITAGLRTQIETPLRDEHNEVPVWVQDEAYVKSYHHYCKQILWPTFHYTLPTTQSLEEEPEAFRAYLEVNQRFAERLAREYREGDVIMVQDYHLLLVPQLLREQLPDAPIGLFVHVAFPSSEIFRCLSRREELLRGMLGADLLGFQTHNFCRHFRQTVGRILQEETTARGVQLARSFVTVAPFPIGIDVHTLNRRRSDPEVHEWVVRLQERFAGKHVIVGRDKLDWIKGVREKLIAFELFLDTHREWVGRVVLVQVALATVQDNREVGDVSDIVARINRKHSSLTYQPVVFLHVQEITFSQYLALLTMADAFMATSLREGMNLTTHEYVVAQEQRKRPLILSEFTGTYSALRACIGVNPFNACQVAKAIHCALTMDEDEMAQRWYDLHRTVVTQTAQHWVTAVLSQLERAHLSQPHGNTMFTPRLEIAQLQSEWRAAKSRLVLLDLEHTLMSEATQGRSRAFEPPPALVRALRGLVGDERTYVYLMSSKSMADLEALSRAVPEAGLIAEDGCYVRHCVGSGPAWTSLVDGFDAQWRQPVREILDYFTERTPGSWIEERDTAIAWCFGDTTSSTDLAWAQRQSSEVQTLISDSLGERFALRILRRQTHFVIMPKNVSRTSAVQYVLALDIMGSLPKRCHDIKGMFEFVLHIGRDEKLIAHLNALDLPFAPRTCTTEAADTIAGSIASCQLAAGDEVLAALEEIVDVHARDLRWGGPAMLDV